MLLFLAMSSFYNDHCCPYRGCYGYCPGRGIVIADLVLIRLFQFLPTALPMFSIGMIAAPELYCSEDRTSPQKRCSLFTEASN